MTANESLVPSSFTESEPEPSQQAVVNAAISTLSRSDADSFETAPDISPVHNFNSKTTSITPPPTPDAQVEVDSELPKPSKSKKKKKKNKRAKKNLNKNSLHSATTINP
jgi:hypothetical protein